MGTETFKYPCAVELEGLALEQAINLEKAFVKFGADLYESFTSDGHVPDFNPEQWKYYGIEYDNTTVLHDAIDSYEDEGSDEVTLYTYDEVMKFANIAQEEQATPTYTGATDSEGWILNTGTEPQYLLDGGKVDVKFNNGSVIKNVTDENRGGDSAGNYTDFAAHDWRLSDSDGCVHSWKPSVASSTDDADVSEENEYSGSQEGETLSKATTGASVDITINVTIDGRSWGITRDEAFKLCLDLIHIFEEKVV